MRARTVLIPVVTAAMSCGVASSVVVSAPSSTQPPILFPVGTQALFNDALQWSRYNHMETGGCFTVHQHPGKKFILIFDAVERVKWRREHKVRLDCAPSSGIWHTHWQKESQIFVGCNMARALDLYLISPQAPLGVVVCGIGKDSVIPYGYDPKTDSLRQVLARTLPQQVDTDQYRCADEPEASLKRPTINCQR